MSICNKTEEQAVTWVLRGSLSGKVTFELKVRRTQ